MITKDASWTGAHGPHEKPLPHNQFGKWICYGNLKSIHHQFNTTYTLIKQGILWKSKYTHKENKDCFFDEPAILIIYCLLENKDKTKKILKKHNIHPKEWKTQIDSDKSYEKGGELKNKLDYFQSRFMILEYIKKCKTNNSLVKHIETEVLNKNKKVSFTHHIISKIKHKSKQNSQYNILHHKLKEIKKMKIKNNHQKINEFVYFILSKQLEIQDT